MIAVDWGSSSLRAYRLAPNGNLIAQRRSSQGVLACEGDFSGVLASLIDDWSDPTVVLCGMIGSRSGWVEVPYLACPASPAEVAGALIPMEPSPRQARTLWFVPGLAHQGAHDVPDVMRGEETQLCALLPALGSGAHIACLPGTHSKWATLSAGRIDSITTALTGETYAVLRQHSILGKLMEPQEGRYDSQAFQTGLARSGQPGGLLHHLFGVRTTGLFAQFSASALPWYLSGLLIGHEIRALELLQGTPQPLQVHLIGNDSLVAAYARALVALGIGVQRHPEDLAAAGMYHFARLRDLEL